jgi:hypothetical protein
MDYLESDLFFCFNNLMIEVRYIYIIHITITCRDGFLRELDKELSGISGKVHTYAKVLKEIDPDVWQHLEDQGLNH